MTTVANGAGTAVKWLGELEKTPLAEVIRRIVAEERSGDLRLTSTTAVKTLHFDRGFIVFASSNVKTDSLGERLISSGRISPHEFALVKMLTKESKRSFRQALAHAGIVPEEELGRHVAAQVNQIVLSVFSWKEGTYSFEEGPCSIPLELMVSLSAHRILLEGIRRMSSGKLILAGLPSLDSMVRVVQAPPFSLDFDKLRPVEKSVLRIADTRITIRQILGRAGDDKGKVLRACYGLFASGVLESVSEDARRAPRKVQEETGTFVVSEILRKIAPREHTGEEAPKIPVAQSPEAESMESSLPPSEPAFSDASPFEEPSSSAQTEPAAKTGLKSFEEFEAEQAATTGASVSADEAKKSTVAQVFSAILATLSGLWAALSTAFRGAKLLWNELRGSAQRGRASDEGAESQFESQGTETMEPPAPLSPPEPQGMRPVDEVGQEDATPQPSLPSWSVVDDPHDPPLPTTDPQEFLEQPEEVPEIRTLGVPKWSMQDDPDEAPPPPIDTYQETPPQPAARASETFEPPSWSMEDRSPAKQETRGSTPVAPPPRSPSPGAPPDDPADLLLGVEDEEPPARPTAEIVLGSGDEDVSLAPQTEASEFGAMGDPFADPLFGHPDDRPPSTQELFIELEPEEDTESSMLHAIPVEEAHVEDEPELVIVVEEDAFEDLPDVPDPTPPPVRQPEPEPVARQAKPVEKPAPEKAEEPAPKKKVKAKKLAPAEAPTPEPTPAKKLPGPPKIVPRVDPPKQSPATSPAASSKPSSPALPPARPTFEEKSVPVFDEAPIRFEEAPIGEEPIAASPSASSASSPAPSAPARLGRPVPPVAPAPPAAAPPVRPASPAPPAATPPARPASPAPPAATPPVRPASPAPPAATPPVRPASPAPPAKRPAPSTRRAPTKPAVPPKQQPAVGAGAQQPAATGPTEGEIAVNEGLMRAARIKQRGGEKKLLRDVKLHFKVQDWAGAVPLLEELIHIAPGSALYRGMLARAMSRHPEYRSEAEEHFLEALRLAPQDPEIHYWLGVYYLSFGLKARAINEFKTTLRINPQHERARRQMSGGRSGGGVFKKLFG